MKTATCATRISSLRSLYICSSCRRIQQARRLARTILGQQRSISSNWNRKTAEAAEQWNIQGKEIKEGRKTSMLSILEQRGYVNAIAGERDELDGLMTNKRVGAYVGVDPTAPSLHIGHLLPLMALFWLYIHGYHTVSLLGGATAQVGDPTGRTTSRELPSPDTRKANMVKMHYQMKKLWVNVESHAHKKYGYVWEWAWRRELVNNNVWMNKLPIIEVLKLLGHGTRIGTMLGRDTVRNKMEKGDGMSFAEFTYPLLQAYDWWHMYSTKGIQLQIGGSDQFGNIIAGMDAIKHIAKTHYDPEVRQKKEDPLMKPMGFTVPLLTTASGEKFGKSAGNAVWLDKEMTSTFNLYQFFLRSADADVGRYLRLFTFIPLPEIGKIINQHEQQPSKRVAQRKLAREIIELIHGIPEADAVESQHGMLFRSAPVPKPSVPDDTTPNTNPDISSSLNPNAPATTSTNAPPFNVTLPKSLIYNQPIARVLYSAGLVSSRSEGHRLASQRGAYIGSKPGQKGGMRNELEFTPIVNWKPEMTQRFIVDGNLLVLRVGKWKVKIVKVVSDEEFELEGLDAPGWKEWKEGRMGG